MHGNTDGAGLVRNRTRNRLTNPPCRIGAELVPTAIFKFIDRFHKADIALLNEIKELKAAVGVFLCDGNNEAQIGLDHFLLCNTRFAFALLHHVDDAAEFTKRHAGIRGDVGYFCANALNPFGFVRREGRPFFIEVCNIGQPIFVELMAHIAVKKRLARNLVTLGQAQHLAAKRGQATVE